MSKSSITIVLFLSALISIASAVSFGADNRKTLLIFSASWCGPCHIMKQDLNTDKKLKEVIKNYDIIELDYDVDKDVVQGYNIKTVPSFVIMHNGKEIGRKIGYVGGPHGLYQFLK